MTEYEIPDASRPWDARPSGYSYTGYAGGPFYWNVYAGNSRLVDYLSESDARLIAAAPEMLEALKAVRENCPYCQGSSVSHYETVGRQVSEEEYIPEQVAIECQFCTPVRSAIAKAEGQP